MVMILGYLFLLFHEKYGYSLEAPRIGLKIIKDVASQECLPA